MAVVRHEMGHAKMNHALKNMLIRCLFYSLMFVSLSVCLLLWEKQILAAFGVQYESLYLALFILGNFAMSVPFYLFEVIEKIVSRQQEIDADIFSWENAEEGNKESIK